MKRGVTAVNIPIAIASLAISVLLYATVLPTWTTRSARRIKVPLTIHANSLDTKKFYIDEQPTSVMVVADLNDKEFDSWSSVATAVVDLSTARPGSNKYPVTLNPVGFRYAVKDQDPRATFVLEDVKNRDVPVIVTTSGKLNDPTQTLDDIKPDRTKATIDGPASGVQRVVSARATLRLDMLDPHAPAAVSVSLDPVDKDDQVVENVDIYPAKVLISPKFTQAPQQKEVFVEAAFGDAPVPTGYSVKNYTVFPTHVTASGSSLALSKIAKAFTEKIDVSRLTSTQTFTVQLQPPSQDVTFAPTSIQVTIFIEPSVKKSTGPPAAGTGSPLQNL